MNNQKHLGVYLYGRLELSNKKPRKQTVPTGAPQKAYFFKKMQFMLKVFEHIEKGFVQFQKSLD